MNAVENSEIQVITAVSDQNEELTTEQVNTIKQKIYCPRLSFNAVCLKSKSAILALCWSLLAAVLQWYYSDPAVFIIIHGSFNNLTSVLIPVYGFFALLQLFYPLAGMLADLRYGRYKCVLGSLWCLIFGFPFWLVLVGLVLFAVFPSAFKLSIMTVILVFLGVPTVIGILLILSSIVVFNANIIQFGLDQLHDSPTEHLVLYIHWYVLLYYSGRLVFRLTFPPLLAHSFQLITIPIVLFLLCYLLLLLSLCIGYRKRHTWFMRDTGSRNPYILVYKVLQFARKHRYPVRRSAFTYCEDELPSRLDLAKEKYGGPFTTEQVENVKIFLSIMQVLVSLGPVFAVEKSTYLLLPGFSAHVSEYLYPFAVSFTIKDVLPLMLSICITVFYIVLLRPFIYFLIPGMLRRIWFGVFFLLIPALFSFVADTVSHTSISRSSECFLNVVNESNTINDGLSASVGIISPLFFIPNFFYSFGFLIFHIAIFEFICSQSPHSMKGLLIGAFYAIRGIFQLLGALLFMLPFLGWRKSSSFPSCGFIYYLINIIVALIGIVAYTWNARRYRNRQRDEPDNIYRYAEEYYDKSQGEPSSGYDDYDNLNVHTIG